MAGLVVLRRASGLSDAYRPRWQRQVFEQAVLGKTPSLFRALPHASARRRGEPESSHAALYSAIPLGTIMSGIKSWGGR